MIAVSTKFLNNPEPRREEDSHQRHDHRPWHRSRRDPAGGGQDYISLTDMLKAKDGDFLISDWLHNRAFETLDALEDTLVSALRNLELNPETVQSICQSDWIVNPISIAN